MLLINLHTVYDILYYQFIRPHVTCCGIEILAVNDAFRVVPVEIVVELSCQPLWLS